jgi:carbamoyltransferase
MWIPSAAGDAGGALGAALFVSHQMLDAPRAHLSSDLPAGDDGLHGSLLGPNFTDGEIRALLEAKGIPYHPYAEEHALVGAVVAALIEGRVVGWFQDRMEFGPRALGARSILGDPRHPEMQARMNLRIKFRESFRPFAPSCLAEYSAEWFDLDRESPYMLLVAPLREKHRTALTAGQLAAQADPDLRKRVNVPRSSVPAITHVDYSARIQTVTEARNRRYARLLAEFARQTGCPMLVNTSMNIRGEPIACTPQDALRCFLATDMDVLVLENCVLYKTEQPLANPADREQYLRGFALD